MERGFLSVNEFAKLSRMTRDKLYYYEKKGLLPPISRGENKYRYYSIEQLTGANLINVLLKLGMSLKEIQYLGDHRTPQKTYNLLMDQVEVIDQEISKWEDARKLLVTVQKSIHSALDVDEDAIAIESLPAKPIILGEPIDYTHHTHDYDALKSFYRNINIKYPDLDLNYSVWAIFSKERVKSGDLTWPDRYYFNNPAGYDKRPAGLYAVGYMRCGYGKGAALYEKMLAYIDDNGFEICGNAYEEYPLNELCVQDSSNYLLRLLIHVRRK